MPSNFGANNRVIRHLSAGRFPASGFRVFRAQRPRPLTEMLVCNKLPDLGFQLKPLHRVHQILKRGTDTGCLKSKAFSPSPSSELHVDSVPLLMDDFCCL
jgi:hypothetical protein